MTTEFGLQDKGLHSGTLKHRQNERRSSATYLLVIIMVNTENYFGNNSSCIPLLSFRLPNSTDFCGIILDLCLSERRRRPSVFTRNLDKSHIPLLGSNTDSLSESISSILKKNSPELLRFKTYCVYTVVIINNCLIMSLRHRELVCRHYSWMQQFHSSTDFN